MLGLEFEIRTAQTDETMDPTLSVEAAVQAVCRRKAEAVGQTAPGQLVLAADTIVVVDDRILGKPADPEDAVKMLQSLSGRRHRVLTAFCLWRDGVLEEQVEQTWLQFRPLSLSEIRAYVATGSPLDKAGAYGIQDQASVFAEKLEGDYYNVMGLPLCALTKALRRQGVPVLGTVEL